MFSSMLREFALGLEFAELRAVVRIGNTAGAKSIADGE
jgi:hypothetical protein